MVLTIQFCGISSILHFSKHEEGEFMKLDKKAISKALCLSAVCCVLLTNVAYANDKTNCENVQTASIAVNTTDAYYKVIEQKNVYAEEKNPFLEIEYLI